MSPARRSPVRAARQLARRLVPALPSFVRLLAGLMRDARVSLLDRGLLVAVLVYVVSPLDLIPDVLGLFGLGDDLFLLALVLRRLLLGAGREVLESHWSGPPEQLGLLVDSVDELGSLVPGPLRPILEAFGGR